ncbi:secreted antigen 3 [Babesia divergens]|uniref:Secreted antigen 3 n=1 Tax=Babesia divergens TaxID=32595 RepID=A0AAD9GIL4_BABDI|nr:secreted antigen 3 [Babesia divergens]
MTDQDSQACNFQEPETLKDILDLLVKLGTGDSGFSSVSGYVLLKLEEEAKKYFKDGSEDSDILSSLGTVFTRAKTIRGSIISDSRGYPKYSSLNDHDSHDCVPKALKTWLPKAYAALLFMLFNCDREFSGYSLGEWKDQKVNDSGVSSQDIFNWLTKEKTGALILTPGLIKRGFSDRQLTSNTGQTVAQNIKESLGHDSAKALQKALSYLLFSCDWDNALLGHALCFLSMFCVTVQSPQKNFKGYSEELKDVCLGLSGSLTSFLNGSSQSHILAVSQGTSNVYSGVFKDESLDDYCDWLKDNLERIIQSLKAMSSDCKNWSSPHSFEWGYTAGPFLYGFVPKDKSWMNRINENLPKAITPLIESLNELQKALEPSSSTAAAAAGAAYATNAFGLKDIITGLISRFLS